MEQKRNRASQNLYGSLPPQVVGKVCGKLLLRVKNLNLFDNSGSYGKKIKFEWWGEKNGPIVLQVPWKSGNSVTEATFQICAPQSALRDYFSDMGSLKLYLVNSDMISIGRVIIPLDKLNENDFHFDSVCPVRSLHGLAKKDIGTLLVEIRTRFYEIEQKKVQQSVVNEIPEVNDTKLIQEDYPENPKHKLEFSKNSLQDSFQRNEALAFTDHSEKYSQWPTVADKNSKQHQHKQSNPQRGLSEHSATSITNLEEVAIADDKFTQNNLPEGKHSNESNQNSQTIKSNSIPYITHTATPRKKRARPFTTANRVTFRPDIPSHNSKIFDTSLTHAPISTSIIPTDEYQQHSNNKLDNTQLTNNTNDSSNSESHHLDGLQKSAPTPNKISPYSNPMDDILLKAETLLNRVQNSVKQSTQDNNYDNIRLSENHPSETKIVKGTETDLPTSGNTPSNAYEDHNKKVNRTNDHNNIIIASDTSSGHVENMQLKNTYNPTYTEDSITSKLNWLLMGVPEVFEEDPEDVNDELVDRLLQEGGPPPSQLMFPSLHYASQIAMQKLANIRALRITITRLHINSSKCGVRKLGSYLQLQPPVGCIALPMHPTERRINLNDAFRDPNKEGVNSRIIEYRNKNRVVGGTAARQEKRTLQMEYVVGIIDMHYSETWIVQLNNNIISSWLSNQTSDGTLRLELYSCLDPMMTSQSSTRKNGKHIEFMKFGYANIPLSGLLNTNNLDAMLTCILEADPTTSNIVKNKFEKLPYSRATVGMSGSTGTSGSTSLGSVTVRITLLEDETQPAMTTADKDLTDAVLLGIPVAQMKRANHDSKIQGITTGNQLQSTFSLSLKPPGSRSEGEVNLDRALAFLPLEARRLKAKSDISPINPNDENGNPIIFQTYQREDSSSTDRYNGIEEYKSTINSPLGFPLQQDSLNKQEDRKLPTSPIVMRLRLAGIHIDLLAVKRLPFEVINQILIAASTLQPTTPMLSNPCDFKLVVSYKVACGAGDSIRERIEIPTFQINQDNIDHIIINVAINDERHYSLTSMHAWKLNVLEIWAEYVLPSTIIPTTTTTTSTTSPSNSLKWHRCLLGLATTVADSTSRSSYDYPDWKYNNQQQPMHTVAIIDPIHGDVVGQLSYGITTHGNHQSLENRHLEFIDDEIKDNREVVVVDEDNHKGSLLINMLPSTNQSIFGTTTIVNQDNIPLSSTTNILSSSFPTDCNNTSNRFSTLQPVDVSASLSLSQISVDSLISIQNPTRSPPRLSYPGATSTTTDYSHNMPAVSIEMDSLMSNTTNVTNNNTRNNIEARNDNNYIKDENKITNDNITGLSNSEYPVTSDEFEVVLDMYIEDSVMDATDGTAAVVAVGDSLGCFVFYNFPYSSTESSQITTMPAGTASIHTTTINHHQTILSESTALGQHCLWWDSQCSILNSRSRHIFQLKYHNITEGGRSNSHLFEQQEGIDVDGSPVESHLNKDITFRIVLSDEEGGTVARNTTTGSAEQHQIAAGTVFANVILKEKEWLPFVQSRPTGVKRLTLPLLSSIQQQQRHQQPIPKPMYLRLVLEHRRVPCLYNCNTNLRYSSLVATTVSDTKNIPNPIDSYHHGRLLPLPATTPPHSPLLSWNDTPLKSKPLTLVDTNKHNESLVDKSEAVMIALEEIYNLKLVPDVGGSALIVSATVCFLDSLNSNNDMTSESLHSTLLQTIQLSNVTTSEEMDLHQLSSHKLFEWKNTSSDSSFPQVKIPLGLGTGSRLSNMLFDGGEVDGRDNDRDVMRRLAVVIHLHLRPPWRMTPPPTTITTTTTTTNDSFHSLHQLQQEQQHPPYTTSSSFSLSPSLLLGDHLIGHAVVQLSPLATGFPYIQGWYHIQDTLQRCQGQLKLSVYSAASSPPRHSIRTSIASLADFPYYNDGFSDGKENISNNSHDSEFVKSTGTSSRLTVNQHDQSKVLDTNLMATEMLPKENFEFEYNPLESKNNDSTSRLQRLVESLENVRQKLTCHHEVTISGKNPETDVRSEVCTWDRPLYEAAIDVDEEDQKESDTSLHEHQNVRQEQVFRVPSKDGSENNDNTLNTSSRWQENSTMKFIREKEVMIEESVVLLSDDIYELDEDEDDDSQVEDNIVSFQANQKNNRKISYLSYKEESEEEDDVNCNEASNYIDNPYDTADTDDHHQEEEEEEDDEMMSYFLSKPIWSPSHGFSSLLEEKESNTSFENENNDYYVNDSVADDMISNQVADVLLGDQCNSSSTRKLHENNEIIVNNTAPSLATDENVEREIKDDSQFNELSPFADELVTQSIQTSSGVLHPTAMPDTEKNGCESSRLHEVETGTTSLQPVVVIPSSSLLTAPPEGIIITFPGKESLTTTAIVVQTADVTIPHNNINSNDDNAELSLKDLQQDRQTVSVSSDISPKESVDSAIQCDISLLQTTDVPPASCSDIQGQHNLISANLTPNSIWNHEMHHRSSSETIFHTSTNDNPLIAVSDSGDSKNIIPYISMTTNNRNVPIDTISTGDQISDNNIPNELLNDSNISLAPAPVSVSVSAVNTQDKIRQLVEEEVARVLQSTYPVIASSSNNNAAALLGSNHRRNESSSTSSVSDNSTSHPSDIPLPTTTTATFPSNSVKKPLPIPTVTDDILKRIGVHDTYSTSSIDSHTLRDNRTYTNASMDHSPLLNQQNNIYYQNSSHHSNNSERSLPYNSIGLQIIETSGYKKSSFVQFPGRRKKFIDSETDRISKIMMSKLSQPGVQLIQK